MSASGSEPAAANEYVTFRLFRQLWSLRQRPSAPYRSCHSLPKRGIREETRNSTLPVPDLSLQFYSACLRRLSSSGPI